jgi:hypothetical protein
MGSSSIIAVSLGVGIFIIVAIILCLRTRDSSVGGRGFKNFNGGDLAAFLNDDPTEGMLIDEGRYNESPLIDPRLESNSGSFSFAARYDYDAEAL